MFKTNLSTDSTPNIDHTECGPQRAEQQNETSETNTADDEGQNDNEHSVNEENQPGAVSTQVKPGQTVAYVDMQTGDICVAEVLGRAGKATGQNNNWYNLRYSVPNVMKGAQASVDLSE